MTDENFLQKCRTIIIKYQFIAYFVLSVVAFSLQMFRQSGIEQRLADAERSAIHRAETAYTVGISGLLQTATILESNLVEIKQQNLLLIECAKKKTCDQSPELLQTKIQKEYVPVATHYFKIQQQMIEESKEER